MPRLQDLAARSTRPARPALRIALALTATLGALDALGAFGARDAGATVPATAAVTARASRGAPAPITSLLATLPARRDAHRPTLYVVMRDADCPGVLELLALLDRPRLARGLARGGVLLVGADSTARALRVALDAHRLAHPVRVAPPTLADALARITHPATPLLLVVATDGSLRYVAPAPASLADEERLARVLGALVDDDDDDAAPRLAHGAAR